MNSNRAVALGCECGDLFLASTLNEARDFALEHIMEFVILDQSPHKILSETNVGAKMSHPELSVLRDVVHNDGLTYRANQADLKMVANRRRFERRDPLYLVEKGGGPSWEPLGMTDDGLGVFRGVWSVVKIYVGIGVIAAGCWMAIHLWRML